MPSRSYAHWLKVAARSLDEMENAHAKVGGIRRGRRYATEQINHAYTVLLSSQFQGFCRDLHSESVDHLAHAVSPAVMRSIVQDEFMLHRRLDAKNPSPSVIGADFNRLGVDLWDDVRNLSSRNLKWKDALEELNIWRNAVAHQDFDPVKLIPHYNPARPTPIPTLTIRSVRRWRAACNGLARAFDSVLSNHLNRISGVRPW